MTPGLAQLPMPCSLVLHACPWSKRYHMIHVSKWRTTMSSWKNVHMKGESIQLLNLSSINQWSFVKKKKKKKRIKPTYTVHDRNRNKNQLQTQTNNNDNNSNNNNNNNNHSKNRNFSTTFRHLCRQLFGNSSTNLWLSLPSNWSWTCHCIFWKMNSVLHYNSCQLRLINKT